MSHTLENMYEVFENYTCENLDFCLCCYDVQDIEKLRDKPLECLDTDDLDVYFKSALMIGDVNAFKFFLPKIMEVFEKDFDLLPQIQYNLEGWDWRNWNLAEIEAIENHLLFLWKSADRFYDSSKFLLLFSFSRLLELWQDDPIFLKKNIEHWEVEPYFLKSYSEKRRKKPRLFETEKRDIVDFLGQTYLEVMDDNPEYATAISEVIAAFSKCKTHV